MSTNSTSSHHHRHSLSQSYASPPVTIVLTIILLVFFFLGFFSIYFCRCFAENLIHTWNLRRSPSSASLGGHGAYATRGLHPSIIKSFPTFPYSAVKGFHDEKYGLECAICLTEFRDETILRLLAGCSHVFHQECIDLWLESHKTCPVCRRALDSPPKLLESPPVINNNDDQVVLQIDRGDICDYESMDDTFSIDLRFRGELELNDAISCSSTRLTQFEQKKSNTNNFEILDNVERFPRSHSTGHSVNKTRAEEDRFTLRLPEHVKVKIARGRRNQTGSCIAFGEISNGSVHGFGESSGTTTKGDINTT